MTHAWSLAFAWWLVCALALPAAPACAQEAPQDSLAQDAGDVSPPPEADDGDYTLERADEIGDRSVETRFGAHGSGGAPKQTRAVRFRGDGSEGSFVEGDDVLAGGRYRARLGGGALAWGRLSPRWGCGLLLGAAADPWRSDASDRGAAARFRGRAGEGALYVNDAAAGGVCLMDALAGRFAKRAMIGARVGARGFALGVLQAAPMVPARGAPATANAAASAAFEQSDAACEWACDARGRWRAEGRMQEAAGAAMIILRARAGHAAYRSLAEGARSGPAQLLAVGAAHTGMATRVRADAALWSFGQGLDGSRAALEVQRPLGHHATASLGCEEQHGLRRVPAALSRPAPAGMRQGVWAEWSTAGRGQVFSLRQELWGERAFARVEVRRLLAAGVEMPLPAGARLSVRHAVWRTAQGERLYLPEDEVDRVTLRSLSGTGARTRLQAALPILGGRARASLVWTDPSPPRATPGWSVEWTRRVRR